MITADRSSVSYKNPHSYSCIFTASRQMLLKQPPRHFLLAMGTGYTAFDRMFHHGPRLMARALAFPLRTGVLFFIFHPARSTSPRGAYFWSSASQIALTIL